MSEKTDSIVRRLFKSGTFLFVGQVFELAISFIAALIIARYLGPTGYGAIAIGVAIVNGALSFLLLGLSGGIARYLPWYDDIRDQRGVVISAFHVTLPVSIAAALALFFGADFVATSLLGDPDISPVLQVFAVAIPFAVVRELSLGVMKGL
jgi:O-antigen/teichoic acid export membrane protein